MGTQELQLKRLMGLTSEPLDMCLQNGLITEEQHWAGIHFRWLYTLRFGVPTVKAVNTTNVIGLDMMKPEDEAWCAGREQEYRAAVAALDRQELSQIITDICIHNVWPMRLDGTTFVGMLSDIERAYVKKLQRGLDVLSLTWLELRIIRRGIA